MEEMEFVNDVIFYMYFRFNYCDKIWYFKFVLILIVLKYLKLFGFLYLKIVC